MKKSIIAAGAASAVLAAMPVVGVFAAITTENDTALTDTLNITNKVSCAMSREHAAAATTTSLTSSAWANGETADTLTAIVATSTLNTLGSTTFTVICNDTEGWGVNASYSALTGKTDNTQSVPNGTPSDSATAYKVSYTQPEGGSLTLGGDNAMSPAVSSNTSAEGVGAKFTATYAAQINTDKKAQTYEGNVVYTLYHNVVSD